MRNQIVWLAALCLGSLGLTPGLSQEVVNMLENGGFEAGDMTAWANYGGAAMEVVETLEDASIPEDPIEGNNALHVVVDAAGANSWSIGLQHPDHVFEEGKYYTFSTFMKSKSGELQVRLKPELGGDPWTAYGEVEITITEEWAEYSTTLPVFTADVSPATLTYHIAFASGDFWVDGVRFYEGDYVEPDFLNNISSSNPVPESGQEDVGRDYTILGWKPDPLAGSHNIYLGETFADVNAADSTDTSGILIAQEQDANTIALDRLELGKTYYWRVDEVNATPDKTTFKGSVWSFTVEPAFYLIPSASITTTASSTGIPYALPENTVNETGLSEGGQHSIDLADMWISSTTDPNIWIQYDIDGVYKLQNMKIWNNNQGVEPLFGVGAKNITIETSLDGVDWNTAAEMELARAPGSTDYEGAAPIDMNGVAVQAVRVNIHDNWGGIIAQAGLSEVQLMYIPLIARYEKPLSGSSDVSPDGQLSWRPGREAGQHLIYLGTDAGALELVDTVTEPSVDLSSLDIQLATTYFWRVDEVNDAEGGAAWAGPVWRFRTPTSISVDNFESFGNFSPNRPFQTWLDGFGYSSDEFFSVSYAGNGTGSGVGHDIWGVSSPYYNGDIMETSNVRGGRLSLPFYYSNTGGETSHIDRTWSTPQDWSQNGIETLIVNFHGDPNNAGTSVYVEINGQKVTYPDDADLKVASWHQWPIDLASLGINLSAVTSMSIGVEGTGSGMILVDELSLCRTPPSLITAWYSLENNTDDVSGNGHHGAAVGDPVYVPGAEGTGILFDGTGSQYVDLGNFDPSDGTGQLSVSLWAQWQGLTSFYQGLIGKRDSWSSDDMMWHIEADISDGAIKFQQTAGGILPGQILPVDEWTHVGVSFNGNTARIYISGIEVGSGGFAFGSDTEASIQFGAVDGSGGNPFNGALDEIKIYNRALSALEMQELAGL